MSILENLKRTQVAVTIDNFKKATDPSLGTRIGRAAVAAIMNGIGSDEWKRYMALFCDTREQLQRLTVEDTDNEEDYMPQMRAYMVANAVCFSETFTQTANGVGRSVEPIPGVPLLAETPEPADLRAQLTFSIPQV